MHARRARDEILALRDWRETVRDIYDMLHLDDEVSIFSSDRSYASDLASRIIGLIENRHPDFFVEAYQLEKGDE